MPIKLIVSLTPYCYPFMNAVARYCQVTETPATPERRQAIYQECLSQIVQKLDTDAQRFMINLMELPVWATIYYSGKEMDYDAVCFFADEMRVFAMAFWTELHNKDVLVENHFYLLESCSSSVAIISSYIDSAYT